MGRARIASPTNSLGTCKQQRQPKERIHMVEQKFLEGLQNVVGTYMTIQKTTGQGCDACNPRSKLPLTSTGDCLT